MANLSSGPDGSTDTVTLTTAYEVLADKTRCAVLTYLANVDHAVSLDALVDDVAAELTSGKVDSRFRDRVIIQLHHIHLPKMDAVDVIDYDQDGHLIEPTAKITVPLQLLDQDAASSM